MGKGVIGVAVQPILGVTDGIAAVAHGVTSQVDGTHKSTATYRLRGRRVFQRERKQFEKGAEYDDTQSISVLLPLSKVLFDLENESQKRNKTGLLEEILAIAQVSENSSEVVVISTKGIHIAPNVTPSHLRNNSKPTDYYFIDFRYIGYFARSKRDLKLIGIYLLATEGTRIYQLIKIECSSEERSLYLWNELYAIGKDRVSNPSAMIEYF